MGCVRMRGCMRFNGFQKLYDLGYSKNPGIQPIYDFDNEKLGLLNEVAIRPNKVRTESTRHSN